MKFTFRRAPCRCVDVIYLHLPPSQSPPALSIGPFSAVIVAEAPVVDEWRELVCEWLVRSGCLYLTAWGVACEQWHDGVDHANLREFDYGDIPDEKFVMTTWHTKDPLSEVFWLAQCCVEHPTVELGHTLIVHVAENDRRAELLKEYDQAGRE